MSVQGTGIAAAVAQTGLQAQQVGRQQAKERVERARTARRLREAFETQLKGVEESDATEAESPLLHVSTTHRDASQQGGSPEPALRKAAAQKQEAEDACVPEAGSAEAAEAEPAALPTAYAYDAGGHGPPPPPHHQLDVQA